MRIEPIITRSALSTTLAWLSAGVREEDPAAAATLLAFAGMLVDPNPHSFGRLCEFCEDLARVRVAALEHESP